MITPLITLGGVAVLCSAGYALVTAFNWLDEVEIEPRNKKVKVGKEKKEIKEDSNDDKISNLGKRLRSGS
ncbi:DUF7394 family protein [Aquibacillus saliphilus]|uniref:DUF7394 family protein n=1 Tax=Aquibacillus saliphilus TaxID=1909422 RepID=UPI001CF00111|nr:hypothetical protein [Aquibacillus saliphilus]